MRQALRDVSRDDAVLVFPDDLSCGPIDSDDTSVRIGWRASFRDTSEIESALPAFWEELSKPHDRLVLWFGRHAAIEFAFLLACADRLENRPYAIVDVTGLHFPPRRAGDTSETPAMGCISLLSPDQLASLLGTERDADRQWRLEMSGRWRQLKQENAPFRIVTQTGLESAPIDVFDSTLLTQATIQWQKLALVVGMTLASEFPQYIQTDHTILLTRIVALIEDRKLEVEGDPWDMHACRVRLPA